MCINWPHFKHVRQWLLVSSALAVCFVASGCEVVTTGVTFRFVTAVRENINAANLAPVNSGSGLIVCEPITSTSSSATASFGAGCARWLQFMVAGRPELGKSPAWESLDRLGKELGKPHLQLTEREIAPLATMAGVTHVAVGYLEGGVQSCTLHYQLCETPSGRPVGPAVLLSGTEQQVLAELPGVAKQWMTSLGVSSPAAPPVNMDASDLAFLGRLPRCAGPGDSLPDAGRLRRLAEKSPLAGMLLLRWCPTVRVLDGPIVDHLVQQAPENGIALLELAQTDLVQLARYQSLIEQNLRHFPNCYLMNRVGVSLNRTLRNPEAELRLAKYGVRCASESPDAWLCLGRTWGNRSGRVRKARLSKDISDKEWTLLRGAYGERLRAVQTATILDPRDGLAWMRLAQAACFANEGRVAERAFWKADALDRGDSDLYNWGLEMFQPKWLDQPDSLNNVARLAISHRYASPAETGHMGAYLQSAGFDELATQIEGRSLSECRARLRRDPQDVYAVSCLGGIYLAQGRPSDAEPLLRSALKTYPQSSDPHYELGVILGNRGLYDQAAAEYKTSLDLDPDVEEVQSLLEDAQRKSALMRRTEAAFRLQVQQQPLDPQGHVNLSGYLIGKNQIDEALAEARTAVRLAPDGLEGLIALIDALTHKHQYKEALQVASHASARYPNDGTLHDQLSYTYGEMGQQQASVNECLEAIRLNPQDALAHVNLGDALFALGRKSQARYQWNRVLSLDQGAAMLEAQEMLAKHP